MDDDDLRRASGETWSAEAACERCGEHVELYGSREGVRAALRGFRVAPRGCRRASARKTTPELE